jgi:hypothetical protein
MKQRKTSNNRRKRGNNNSELAVIQGNQSQYTKHHDFVIQAKEDNGTFSESYTEQIEIRSEKVVEHFSRQPDYKPFFSDDRIQTQYVRFGIDNLYPDYLIRLMDGSPTHNAILKGKQKYIMGNGIEIAKDLLTVEQEAMLSYRLSHINSFESINDVLSKVIADFEMFNGWALRVVYDSLGNVSKLFHVPFANVRVSPRHDCYYYREYWSIGNVRYSTSDQDFLPYNPTAPNRANSEQLLYVTLYTTKGQFQKIYPKPEYLGAVRFIETEREIGNLHLNNVYNGFMASAILTAYEATRDEQSKNNFKDQFNDQLTGATNAGKFIINFAASKEYKLDIDMLQVSNVHEMYNITLPLITQAIITGHQVTSPMLFGIKTEGQLGGTNELQLAYEIFQSNYVNSRQKFLESWINSVLGYNGQYKPLYIKPSKPFTIETDKQETKAFSSVVCCSEDEQMSEEESKLLELLLSMGEDVNKYETVRTRSYFDDNEDEDDDSYKFSLLMSVVINDVEAKIIDLYNDNPFYTLKEISRLTAIQEVIIRSYVADLIQDGYLALDNAMIKPTPKALETQAVQNQEKTTTYVNRYVYQVRSGLGAPLIPGSRPFCRRLINANLMYSRKQIQTISQNVGRNVWAFTGGEYTNPRTGITTPFCRHVWKQQTKILTQQ